ncbi:MAG: DUF262 domain-containing protein [Oscillospiraceae bacterium]|nr:DUF262 domain-containing protein [Oscillospiraceae bacterium]
MRIIDVLQPDKKTSKWIVDNYKKELLVVDNSFQRNYVWLEKHQISLIETILLGYAIPEIYLWVIDTDPSTGETKYSIVDGQQRIGAVFNFIDGKFRLRRSHLSDKNANYVGKSFNDLSDDEKRLIWSYSFTIRQLPQEVSREEIVKMFLRLNSTDKSLNPQELRNAEFNGEFLNNAQRIANLDFWKKNKIFSTDNIRRMKDIEFVSSLLIFLRNGIESETTQKTINKMYDLFNDKYQEKDSDYNIVISILEEIQTIIDYDPNTLKAISKTTHFYTLFTLTYFLISQQKHFSDSQKQLISEFYQKYLIGDDETPIDEYRNSSKEGTNSKQSRIARLKALRSYLEI